MIGKLCRLKSLYMQRPSASREELEAALAQNKETLKEKNDKRDSAIVAYSQAFLVPRRVFKIQLGSKERLISPAIKKSKFIYEMRERAAQRISNKVSKIETRIEAMSNG